jgi:hypothetical protein
MKVVKLLLVFFSVILLFSISPPKTSAANISGRSSTVIEWFPDADEETAVPVYEYILLNVRDIDDNGMNFKGYGRLATDTQDRVDVDSRLYYAFLEKKGIFNGSTDFRLGRQFVTTTAGASVMDGLDLTFKNVGPVNFRIFGGGNTTYYESYDADDLIWGAEITGLFLQARLNLGLSYVQTWDDSALTKELIGIDFDYDNKETINVYSEFQFNYINNVVSYFLVGGKYYKSPKWNLRTEYLYSLPVFDSTSIYSVFAVDKYQEFMGEYAYNIALGLRAFGRFTHEFYEEFSDANVFEAGIEKIRTEKFSGYLTGVYRNDEDGQDLKGFKVRVAWMFSTKIQAGVGANVDVLDRRIDYENNEDETTSNLVWLYGTYSFTDRVNVQLKLERASSELWDEYYRGRARLNISF